MESRELRSPTMSMSPSEHPFLTPSDLVEGVNSLVEYLEVLRSHRDHQLSQVERPPFQSSLEGLLPNQDQFLNQAPTSLEGERSQALDLTTSESLPNIEPPAPLNLSSSPDQLALSQPLEYQGSPPPNP